MIGVSEWSLIFFLASWMIFPSSANREVHKGVKQKDFYLLWGAGCLPLCLEDVGRCWTCLLKALSPCWGAGVCEHHWAPVSFPLARVHPAGPKCWTSPLAKSCSSGQELLGQGDFRNPSNGIWRLLLPQRPRQQQQQHQAKPPGSERSLSSSSCQAWLLSAVSGASACQRQDFISASLRPYRKPKMFIYVSYCLAKSVCA